MGYFTVELGKQQLFFVLVVIIYMDLTSPSKGGSRASSRSSRRAGTDTSTPVKSGISGFFLMATGQIESAEVSQILSIIIASYFVCTVTSDS